MKERVFRDLDALVPSFDGVATDWEDVLRRAGTDGSRHRLRPLPLRREWPPRRRTAVIAIAAALVIAIAAPAFGLHQVVIDWVEAEPAPERVQIRFDQLGVAAPLGMDPEVIPGSARKVIQRRIGGRLRTLWVAPTRKGGFCAEWTGLFSGCVANPGRLVARPARPGDLNAALLGVTWWPDEHGVLQQLGGHLHARATERLTVEFADGESAQIDVVWVSPPIDAGFYVYEVPQEHRRIGHQVTAIVATDAEGDVLARQVFELTPPEEIMRRHRLPDGQLADLPAKAIVERARRIIDFKAQNGGRVTLWVVPARDGGRCYVHNRFGGCTGHELDVPMAAGVLGGPTVLFSGPVRDDVALVELRYEDGAVERLRPVEGFVLHEIDPRHYERGHRLELVIARDARGRALHRHVSRTDHPGVYPCSEPVDIGRGVMACP